MPERESGPPTREGRRTPLSLAQGENREWLRPIVKWDPGASFRSVHNISATVVPELSNFSGRDPDSIARAGVDTLAADFAKSAEGAPVETPACPHSIAYALHHRPLIIWRCLGPIRHVLCLINGHVALHLKYVEAPDASLLSSSCRHLLGCARRTSARRQRIRGSRGRYRTSILVFSVSCLPRVRTALWSGGASRENRGMNRNPSLS